MKISDLITKNKIIPELKGETKEEIINELIDLFVGDERVYDIDALRKDIFKREKIMSTGIEDGLAIPHCTTNVVKDYIAAFGKSRMPVDFASIDHKPASLFFLIAGNNVKQHMQLLSKIARLMDSKLKDDLLKAKSTDEIQLIFQELDNKVIELKHI
jgi:mannitol/fructose-specific phosphotransferase system IIA component (Ntr-type)